MTAAARLAHAPPERGRERGSGAEQRRHRTRRPQGAPSAWRTTLLVRKRHCDMLCTACSPRMCCRPCHPESLADCPASSTASCIACVTAMALKTDTPHCLPGHAARLPKRCTEVGERAGARFTHQTRRPARRSPRFRPASPGRRLPAPRGASTPGRTPGPTPRLSSSPCRRCKALMTTLMSVQPSRAAADRFPFLAHYHTGCERAWSAPSHQLVAPRMSSATLLYVCVT